MGEVESCTLDCGIPERLDFHWANLQAEDLDYEDLPELEDIDADPPCDSNGVGENEMPPLIDDDDPAPIKTLPGRRRISKSVIRDEGGSSPMRFASFSTGTRILSEE